MLSKLWNKPSKNKKQVAVMNIAGLRKNWDYEVISHNISDNEGNEYSTIDHAKKVLGENAKLEICEELMFDETIVCKFADYDKVNLGIAKKCGFGVIRMLRGRHKDKEYLFSIFVIDTAICIFAYGVLAHNYIDMEMLDKIEKENDFKLFAQDVLGKPLFNEVFEKINHKRV
jgi:hypothetical protein